jgi:hypothetical protein
MLLDHRLIGSSVMEKDPLVDNVRRGGEYVVAINEIDISRT